MKNALFLGASLAALTPAGNALAQVPPPGPAFHRIAAARIEAAEAPVIDGDLSDPSWARASLIDKFYQDQPNVGEPGTEETTVRVMYDENNLYVSFYCYDKNPDQLAIRAMARDGQLASSEWVRVILDPGLTRRNGYAFQVAASGGRRDALIQNNTTNLFEWNTIWAAKVQIMADGWVAEIAIPFRSLAYDPAQTEWGFDAGRAIRHKNENLVWSAYNPTVGPADLTLAGTLTGVTGVSEGLGLDIQVYGTARVERDWQGDATTITGTGGGNAYYKITPALTGTLTYNPDFSDSPLDQRQVNTTRFSLFTAETRAFFLQDAASFEFGGHNFAGSNNARPFFSRNIGLVLGKPASIIGGGKLSGEFAGFGIGALTVLTDDTPAASGQVLSVARVSHPVFAESSVGAVITNGDPTGVSDNTVAGADFQYRNSDMFDGKIFQSDFYYERSFSSAAGDDGSFGAGVNFPNEPWGGRLQYKQVGADFTPALGFANRKAIRLYDGRVENRIRFRDGLLRQRAFAAGTELYTALDNRIESRQSTLQAEIETASNDRGWITLYDNFERVPELFYLPRDVPVAAGDYGWDNVGARIQTSPGRSLQGSAEVICCRFYNGRGIETNLNINYRPSQYFAINPGYRGNYIDLPTGSVNIHVFTLDSEINITPDMQVLMELQYDNISENFAFSARYRWEYAPGDEIFAAFGQVAQINRLGFTAQSSLFSFRLGRTFQF